MNRTLCVYIIKELIPNFIFGFFAFLFIFFMTQVFKLSDLIVVHGVGIRDVTRLVTFILFPFVGMTLPVSLLFAVLISLGRLGQDSELIAIRAGGISITELLKPIIFFSLIILVFSGIFTMFVEPWGFRSFKKLVFEIGKSKISTGIQPGLFNENFYNLVIYTDYIDRKNDLMEHILLYDERDSERPLTVIAKSGKIISDPENLLITLRLFHGNILTREKAKESFRKIDFEKYDINLTLVAAGQFSTGDPRAMSLADLSRRIKQRNKEKIYPVNEIIEVHKRMVIPIACIIFAIFSTGIAGSTKNPKFSPGRGKAIVISMAVIVSYWILCLMGQSYSRKGVLSAHVVMWIPNILFFAMSILVFRFARRRN